jgi:hypothetical protein
MSGLDGKSLAVLAVVPSLRRGLSLSLSLTYSDFYMPVFAIGDILCSAGHGSLGLGIFMTELLLRFLIGGLAVSFFAALGDVFKPKSFAGLFGAAPSVGLATLALTASSDGRTYASMEARSMVASAGAFLLYACLSSRLMMQFEWSAAKASITALIVWFAISLSLWLALLR